MFKEVKMFKKFRLFIFIVSILVVFTGCTLIGGKTSPNDPNAISTVAMQTVQAVMTENAFSTLVAEATNIDVLPTLVETPTSTATNFPESTTPVVIVATVTSIPTFTPTALPQIIDKASFVKDISIPDGTTFSGNTEFKKTWQLRNDGNTTWTSAYSLVFSSGNAMNGKASYSLPGSVKPGETIELSVDLRAPEKDGEYTGKWLLRNANGVVFGLGKQADQPFWVKINVVNYQSESIPSEKYPLDFTAKICDAKWDSNYDGVRIPCGSTSGSTDSYVSVLMQPEFENSYQDDERTIKMHLSGKTGSWMQGFYKSYTVQSGDFFKSIVGCAKSNTGCNVVISLDIKVDGGNIQNIGKWIETYDGKVTSIDINLNDYAGKNVEFILGVSNRSDTSSDIYWLAPRIVH